MDCGAYAYHPDYDPSDEWEYGGLVRYGYAGEEKYYIVPSYASGLYAIEIKPETIGQCAGLKDRNGKLIFEGDIVSDLPTVRRGIVKHGAYDTRWDHGHIGWYLDWSSLYNEDKGWKQPLSFWLGEPGGVHIIGNIHENPELLEAAI